MNTFDTAIFTYKTAHDLGGLNDGKPGDVNLIPSMPGMGIITSIQGECQGLEEKMPIKTLVVTLDQIQGSALGLDSAPVDISAVKVVVVDAGPANMMAHDQQALVEFAQEARKGASVWIVGGNTDELTKALDNRATRFQNTLRGWRDKIEANKATPGKNISP